MELFWRTRRAGALGLTGVEGVGLDWAGIIERKNKIVESWSQGTKASLEKKGITVLEGRARFTGPSELLVGERKVTAERFVIATGSSPARPPIPGMEWAITSDELLDLKVLPQRMVVMGGGAIGMELGFCLARAGTHVTVLQKGPRVLPPADEEMRDALVAIGREIGMEFYTGVNVTRILSDRTVEAEVSGAARRFSSEVVLVASGRPPNVAHLNLENAKVELERGGVKVNGFLQSSGAPRVYAAGDVIGRLQHSPVAWYEGEMAAHNALEGNTRQVDFSVFPTAIFTIPALAQVGLTETEARAQGFKVGVNRSPMKHNAAAGVRDETDGLTKVVYEEGTDRLLGVHVLGPEAEDLIQIASVAMRGGLTRANVGAMHYVFPTLGGAIFDAMAGW